MGIRKIFRTTASLILCFFVILIVFLSSSPAVFGRNLSSYPTGTGGNSKIGVGPGYSSTAPRHPTKQSSSSRGSIGYYDRGRIICNGPHSNCLPTYNTPIKSQKP